MIYRKLQLLLQLHHSYHHQVSGGVRVGAVIFYQFIRPWISKIGRWSGVVGEQQVGFRVVRTTVRDKREPRPSDRT